MGKIKGWVKKNDYSWTKKNDVIEIIRNMNKTNEVLFYSVEIYLFDRNFIRKDFKTKKEATSFATSYMRSN